VTPDHRGAWRTGQLRWDAFYAVILAAVAAVIAAGAGTVAQRVVALTALAAMVPWYILVGRPLMRFGEEPADSRRGLIYVVGIIALFAVAQWQDPGTWYLAWALCPQFFEVAPFRGAMAAVIALNLTAASIVISRSLSFGGKVQALAAATFAIGFSLAYSGWMTRIVAQSTERAELIEQLQSTRAELAAANRDAGVLAERQRLAGEIHDTLAQGFTSIVMLLQAVESQLERDPAVARRHLSRAATTARENLAEARAMVAALAPAQLESASIDDALRRLTDGIGAELGIDARFEIVGTAQTLPPKVEVILLRVGQEALANVRKHAGAHAVSVGLSYGEATVRLAVDDDGGGFDPARVNGGYGLRGMRDRVLEAGGHLQVHSQKGAGTRVEVEVPV